jgi:A118 family predicted phage portal protein
MFIKEGTHFPPSEWAFWYDKYSEYAAWYSGSSEELLRFYTTKIANSHFDNKIFWARLDAEERANAVNMPAAVDIASTSANLLFSESPRYAYDEKSVSGQRMKDIIKENGFNNILLEAAEISAALTGVFLKLDIDTSISKLPIISCVIPENAFPIFRRGRLTEVLFWRTVRIDENINVFYRLFENRKIENGTTLIEYRLYKGTNDKVGHVIPFESIEETASLNLIDVAWAIDGLGCVYIPNMRPNKLCPGSSLGINDYSGCIPLLDSLDLAWTSLIRDIELGMGQIFIDEDLLQREDTTIYGSEKTVLNKFSKFQKCFLKLNLSSWRMGGESLEPIKVVQFEMRVDEHVKSCENIFKNIVNMCGYSPQTFGLDIGGMAESGTALRVREKKSFATRGKKERYWIQGIENILSQAQQLDILYNNYYNPDEFNVELEDSIIIDNSEMSETIKSLDQARAISTEIKVKMQHPNWSIEDIMAEVKKIKEENSMQSETDIFNPEA